MMIELKNVSKVYRKKMKALDEVSVKIDKGEFVYVVGASGAGKSTFIKLLYREEKASKGSVKVLGMDLSKLSNFQVPKYRRQIGVVFQDYKLLQQKTAYDNVAFALEVHGEQPTVIRKKVREALDLVGLRDKAKQLPAQMSGGEQQRIAIARAIVNKPELLIADEPTGNLDPETSQSIIDVLERINSRGTTVVMATHDVNIVETSRHRTLTFQKGEIISDEHEGGYFTSELRLTGELRLGNTEAMLAGHTGILYQAELKELRDAEMKLRDEESDEVEAIEEVEKAEKKAERREIRRRR